MSDHNFEKQIQKQLDELKIPPSDSVWSSVEAQIRKDKRRRRGVIFFPILFLLMGAGIYFISLSYFSSVTVPDSKSVTINPTLSDNKETINPSEKSTTGHESTEQKSLQDNVSNSTSQADGKNEKEAKNNKAKISGNQSQHETIDKNLISDNITTTIIRPISEKYLNNKTAGLKNIEKTDRNKNQVNLNSQRNNDQNINGKKQAVVPDAKHPGVAIAAKENEQQEKKSTGVEATTISDSLSDRTVTNKIDSTSASTLTQSDSLTSVPAVVENSTADNRAKTSKFRWGVNASAGISNMSDGGIFSGGIIGGDKALVADVASLANNTPGNAVPPAIVYEPSSIEKGFSFSIGGFVEKDISKRFSISTGLRYSYYSTHIQVGTRIDSTAMVQNAFGQLNVNQFYRSAPVATTHEYTNRFHFVELPVSVHALLNKSSRVPLYWDAGLSLSYLVSTNALHFDSQTGVYYKDNGLINKVQANFSTGFSVLLRNRSKIPLLVGPGVQYGLTNFMKQDVSTSKHLFYFGLNTKVFLKK